MDSIIRLDSKGTIVFCEAVKGLVPEFAGLNTDHIRYLVLAYDYTNTLLKMLPYKDWPRQACKIVYGHEDFAMVENVPAIKKAFPSFKKLVYDENRELKHRYLQRKRELQDSMLGDKLTPQELNALSNSIKIFDERIKEVDKKISASDDQIMMANKNQKLSPLEIWQRKLKAQMV